MNNRLGMDDLGVIISVIDRHAGHVFGLNKTALASDIVAHLNAVGTSPEPKAEPPRMNVLGFQIIDEMTNEEMIEEAVAFQRGQWVRASRNILKKFVVEARLHLVKARLIEEAKFEPETGGLFGLFGGGVKIDDD